MKDTKGCLGLPEEAVALTGEGDSVTAPVVGDEVEVTISGKVESIDGKTFYVRPSTANGIPIPQVEKSAPADDAEPTEDSLRAAAEKQDSTDSMI